MKCLYCGYLESKVVDSRHIDDDRAIRRRRECISCGKRYTTYEKIDSVPLLVVKKDGSREMFDSEKILRGMMKACEKRPVALRDIEECVSNIERHMQNSLLQEITSNQIGEMVMEELKNIDEVAYVRFASVYRQFKDLNSFLNELNNLINNKS